MDSVIYREEEINQKKTEICKEILLNARTELFLRMRYLDVALSGLRFVPDGGIRLLGTDAACLYFQTQALMDLFVKDQRLVNRAYLHSIFHCLFAHPFYIPGNDSAPDRRIYYLACDITTEFLLDELYQPCLHRPKSGLRLRIYQELRNNLKVVTAQGVERYLKKQLRELSSGNAADHSSMSDSDSFPTEVSGKRDGDALTESCDEINPVSEAYLARLEADFRMDDHCLWQQMARRNPRQQQDRWQEIRERMQTEMETFAKEAASDAPCLYDELRVSSRPRMDYREFLKKFCVLKEETKADLDSFDYIYYHYGLEHYGNMPLIEPLETSELHRIEEFVIVIDTSMSCKDTLVRRFLEETYGILSSSGSFSRQIRVHVMQCDEKVRNDVCLKSLEQIRTYMNQVELAGRGGTDFRPAFAYVEEMLAKGEFFHLRGLIYFTDGYGTYPVKKPPYDTAFVFVEGEDYRDVDVPPWAIRLTVPEEEV